MLDIDFTIHADDTIGMYVADWFMGGWDTIDHARRAPSIAEADRFLSARYLGPDVDGVELTWTITE